MQAVDRSGDLAWGLRSEFLTSSQVMRVLWCQTMPGVARTQQWFSNMSLHPNDLTGLFKLRLLDPTSRVCDSTVWGKAGNLHFLRCSQMMLMFWDPQVENNSLSLCCSQLNSAVTEGWVTAPSPERVLVPPPLLAISGLPMER